MQWSLGLITFWTTRVGAIFEAYYLSELLLSGRVFPLVLTPHWFQTLTWFFPFRWCFSFPIVALTGPIENRDLFIGLGMQLAWILFSIGLLAIVWPRAVRRFSSVGG
jgi:ABC-2 type transport system permease protein